MQQQLRRKYPQTYATTSRQDYWGKKKLKNGSINLSVLWDSGESQIKWRGKEDFQGARDFDDTWIWIVTKFVALHWSKTRLVFALQNAIQRNFRAYTHTHTHTQRLTSGGRRTQEARPDTQPRHQRKLPNEWKNEIWMRTWVNEWSLNLKRKNEMWMRRWMNEWSFSLILAIWDGIKFQWWVIETGIVEFFQILCMVLVHGPFQRQYQK